MNLKALQVVTYVASRVSHAGWVKGDITLLRVLWPRRLGLGLDAGNLIPGKKI
jgi:hypothetical protein